jgi:hypothetical protein
MIKITVKAKEGSKVDDLRAELTAWCIEHIGPVAPRGQHNQKKRKQWAVKSGDYFSNSVNVFVRDPTLHTMLALKWM